VCEMFMEYKPVDRLAMADLYLVVKSKICPIS
jgi:hypothetical protein